MLLSSHAVRSLIYYLPLTPRGSPLRTRAVDVASRVGPWPLMSESVNAGCIYVTPILILTSVSLIRSVRDRHDVKGKGPCGGDSPVVVARRDCVRATPSSSGDGWLAISFVVEPWLPPDFCGLARCEVSKKSNRQWKSGRRLIGSCVFAVTTTTTSSTTACSLIRLYLVIRLPFFLAFSIQTYTLCCWRRLFCRCKLC